MPEVYVPEVGDRLDYLTNSPRWTRSNALVTKVERHGGYTDVWVNNESHDDLPMFNVNHTTGLPNTSYTLGGRVRFRGKDTPEPRVWDFVQPDDVSRVRDFDGNVFVLRDGIHWFLEGTSEYPRSWLHLLNYHAPLTEVVETEYDAALRRLREHRKSGGTGFETYSGRTVDLFTVAQKVIDENA